MEKSLGYSLTYGSSFSPGISYNPDYFQSAINKHPFKWSDSSFPSASVSANDVELVSGADNGVNLNLGSSDAYDSMMYESILNAGLMDYQHKLNSSSAQKQMDFNASEAQKNRDWIDSQRNNQYQTVVEDLKAAGLNPALAYSNGGAGVFGSSPASSSALNVSGSGVTNPIGQIVAATVNSAASISNSQNTNKTSVINSLIGFASSAISTYAFLKRFGIV